MAAAVTLPINDWLFHLENGTILPYCGLQLIPFISIRVNRLCISIVFVKFQQTLHSFFKGVIGCKIHFYMFEHK